MLLNCAFLGRVNLPTPRWLVLGESGTLAAAIVALVVAYSIAFHMIVAPFPRYGIPFRPLLYALAMLPLRAAWLQWRPTMAPRQENAASG